MRQTRWMRTVIVGLALLALTVSVVLAADPAVDGKIWWLDVNQDTLWDPGWQGIAPVITDPQESIPPEYNIKDVYFRSSDDDSTLFVAFDVYAATGISVNVDGVIVLYFDRDNRLGTGEPNPFCPNLGAETRVLYRYDGFTGKFRSAVQEYDGSLWNNVSPGLVGVDDDWETEVAFSAIGATAGEPMTAGIHFENYAAPEDDSVCFTWNPENGGGEGCTPGYWKQKQHFDSWVTPPYYPTILDDLGPSYFDEIFGVGPDVTLLEALKTGGGGENALGRHAVAALLNAAANSGVDYLYTTDGVIQMVKDAYDSGEFEWTKDLFEYENELGCPLN